MSAIGTAVIALIMLCAAIGAVASIRDPEKGLGKEFLEGLHSIGHIFIPVAGIMAAIPLLSQFVGSVFGPILNYVGADPAIAATSLIAVDMGGYQLADRLAESRESWIMAMMIGYMAGATIVFSIPVGLAMVEKRDHKYLALGVLSGILSIPIGVLISSVVISLTDPFVRAVPRTDGPSTIQLHLELGTIGMNLIPLIVFVLLIALGLRLFPNGMIRGFIVFGRLLDAAIKLVLAGCIIEYFTQAFSSTVGWHFDPIIADEEDRFRALEVAGYIGIMLAGAFPMVFLIREYLATPVSRLGELAGLEGAGAAGILASLANILAMFRLIREMRPKDKVLNIAFAVCAAFLFGDHLSFTANFQPNLIPAVMLGKLGGGGVAMMLAWRLSVPKAMELECEDNLRDETTMADNTDR
ncbi:MAG: ethanolamine utilization protein EutH [Planctomycetaceae bacterium]|jgi:ethanolamine transporter|nr:ethanolamine utilization protein EutH [Planctomycetaceae bacterium]